MFNREAKPIRQIRSQLEMLPMMWKMHDRLPAANQQHAERVVREEIGAHARAAAAAGHGPLAREVLQRALAQRPAGEEPAGLRWGDVIAAGLDQLPG